MGDESTPANAVLADDYWNSQPEPDPSSPIPGMRCWGWMSPTELLWLNRTAATMGSVTEIGALHGRSSTALLDGCPGPVYCVDPWNDPAFDCVGSFMRSCSHFPNLRMLVGYSPAVIEQYHVPTVDMTFIDGDHAAASVRADIEGWLPKTRRLICGHDYIHGGGFPDVAAVVDAIFGTRVQVVPGTAIWYVDLDPKKARR